MTKRPIKESESEPLWRIIWLCSWAHGTALSWLVYVLYSRSVRVGPVVSDSATPWTVARQAPPSMGFSRQEYWSGLPFPSPGDLPDPGIEPVSPESSALAGGFFTTEPPGKPCIVLEQQKRRHLLFSFVPLRSCTVPGL